jgi:two-component system sensor histidine kinase/response regulator
MTLARRLIILLAIPVLTLLVVGAVGRQGLRTVEERSRFVAESRIVALATIGNLSRHFERLRVEVRSYVLADTPESRRESRRRFDDSEREVKRLLDLYARELVFSDEGRQLLGEFQVLSGEWLTGAHRVFDLRDAGDPAATGYLIGPLTALAGRLDAISARWIRNNEDLAAEAGRDVVRSITALKTRMDVAIVVAALFSAFFGYVTFHRTARPIRALDASVRSVAAGEYAKDVPFTTQQDEIGGLARSVNFLKGAAAQSHDLLRRTQAQESELRQVNAQADRALELTNAGYWHVPLDGSGWYNSSPRAVAIYGDPPSDGYRYTLDHWAAHVSAADEEIARAAFDNFAAAVEGRVPRYDAVYPYKRPVDGRVVWIHALGHIVRTPEGVATDMFGVAQDITEMKLAELAKQASDDRLRATEQFYHSVLELAPDGLMVVSATGVIQLANKQSEELFGYQRTELIGQSVEMLVPDDVRPRHMALRAGFHEASTVRPMGKDRELLGQRKDGSRFPIEVGLSPLPAAEDGHGRVAVSVRDVTERKQQERAILAAQKKAQDATEMKSLFLANMSHEIRTPMNAIIGLSHLALATALTAKQRDYIAKVHNAGTSLLGIINDILDFSKIEAGRLDLEEADFKLDDVIGLVTTVTGHKATEKGLEFLVHVPPDVPQFLRGDSLRLGQILTNLVNNAVKFTPQGEVRVAAELVELTGDKCHLRISVTDTGIGISREQAERLFQPFTQADMSTTRRHGGTGLGLTIARRLVELMGGQIWMTSEPDAGSTFTFTVWLGLGSDKGARTVVPERLTRLRALIVDDNSAAREILDDLLADVVLERDAVGSGAEALSAIRARDSEAPYDVIFMDWRMPGLDGLATSRQILDDHDLRHHPAIIMVTAFGREDLRDEAEKARLDGFLVKPVTKSTLIDALIAVFVDDADQQAAVVRAAGTGVDLTGARVLLVEDNDINQQIASELLTGVGAQVDIASNGQEAIDRLEQGGTPPPYDVVLMDLQMPVMDGHEATTIIRSNLRTATLPVVAMTAHATIEERQQCLEAGMDGHIAKPIDPRLLFDTVARYRRGSTPDAATPAGDTDAAIPPLTTINVEEGLARVAGNRKLFVSVLRQFLERQADTAGAISRALSAGDNATARRLAHTLKGLGGSLGAKPLQSAAGDVERLLREGAPTAHTDAALHHLTATLSPVIAELRAAFGSPESHGAPEAPAALSEQTAGIMKDVAKLLDDYDAGVVDLIEANRADLRAAFGSADWRTFMDHIGAFAFAEARSVLDGVVRRSTT